MTKKEQKYKNVDIYISVCKRYNKDIIKILNSREWCFLKTKMSEKQKIKTKTNRRLNAELSLLTIPGILLLIVFCYIPMFGIIIAFKDYNMAKGILKSSWNGLDNFKFFFESMDAVRIIRNTIGYGAVFIVLGMVCQVILALILFEVTNKKALKAYQTVMILPNFLSWVIVGYISYVFLSPESGILNSLIIALGGEKIKWYSDPKYWPFILTAINIWKGIGMGSIYYYASLMGIDASIFEAAEIDGANKIQKIKYVSLPSLVPIVVIMLIMNIGNIIRGDFGLFYQIPRDVGLLYPATDIIETYVFRGLRSGNMAQSTAVGLFQSVVGFVLVVSTNFIVKKINPENSLF